MTRVVLPDFRHSNVSKWFEQKITSLFESFIDGNGMPEGELIGLALIRNSPLVYNNALEDDSSIFSNASYCNTSSSNIGPFVPKMEWKLTNNASYTIDDMDGNCQWNISGIIIDLPDCSIKYLDPTSRYNSSDIIGTQGTLCPVATYISGENSTTYRHISAHNVYALHHVKETRASVTAIAKLSNTFIFSQHSSSSIGEHGGVLGTRFESSWQGIKVSFIDTHAFK